MGGGNSDTISLIDLKANPPRVIDTVTVGETPEGLTLSPDGSIAAVVLQNSTNKPKSVAVLSAIWTGEAVSHRRQEVQPGDRSENR